MRGIPASGADIRRLRHMHGWTQESLAAAADCTPRTVRNAEAGAPIDASTLGRLADALQTPFSTLLAQSASPAVTDSDANKQVFRAWSMAFCDQDIATLLGLFDRDIVIEIPASEDLPGGGTHRGRAAVKAHLQAVFTEVRTLADSVVDQGQLHAADDRVFWRGWATGVVVATGMEFQSHVTHDFRFVTGGIAQIVTILDTTEMRRALDKRQ